MLAESPPTLSRFVHDSKSQQPLKIAATMHKMMGGGGEGEGIINYDRD